MSSSQISQSKLAVIKKINEADNHPHYANPVNHNHTDKNGNVIPEEIIEDLGDLEVLALMGHSWRAVEEEFVGGNPDGYANFCADLINDKEYRYKVLKETTHTDDEIAELKAELEELTSQNNQQADIIKQNNKDKALMETYLNMYSSFVEEFKDGAKPDITKFKTFTTTIQSHEANVVHNGISTLSSVLPMLLFCGSDPLAEPTKKNRCRKPTTLPDETQIEGHTLRSNQDNPFIYKLSIDDVADGYITAEEYNSLSRAESKTAPDEEWCGDNKGRPKNRKIFSQEPLTQDEIYHRIKMIKVEQKANQDGDRNYADKHRELKEELKFYQDLIISSFVLGGGDVKPSTQKLVDRLRGGGDDPVVVAEGTCGEVVRQLFPQMAKFQSLLDQRVHIAFERADGNATNGEHDYRQELENILTKNKPYNHKDPQTQLRQRFLIQHTQMTLPAGFTWWWIHRVIDDVENPDNIKHRHRTELGNPVQFYHKIQTKYPALFKCMRIYDINFLDGKWSKALGIL